MEGTTKNPQDFLYTKGCARYNSLTAQKEVFLDFLPLAQPFAFLLAHLIHYTYPIGEEDD
jgi:hypothetical protein